MSFSDSYRRLRELTTTLATGDFLVERADSTPHFFGVSPAGDPVVIFSLDPSLVGQGSNDTVRLAHVSASTRMTADVRDALGHRVASGPLAFVSCDGASESVREAFVRVIGPLVQSVAATPSPDSIFRLLEDASSLLRALASGAAGTVQGLWAEVLLISMSSNPSKLVVLWHSDSFDRFDFVSDDLAIDVKSTVARTREHLFSLDQVRNVDGTPLRSSVVSIMLQRSDDGVSTADLLDEVSARLESDDLRSKLERIALATLGRDFHLATRTRFLRGEAVASMRLFSAADVPAPAVPLPVGVSSVAFRSDLTQARALHSGPDVIIWLDQQLLLASD